MSSPAHSFPTHGLVIKCETRQQKPPPFLCLWFFPFFKKNILATAGEHLLAGRGRKHGRSDWWLLPTGGQKREIANRQSQQRYIWILNIRRDVRFQTNKQCLFQEEMQERACPNYQNSKCHRSCLDSQSFSNSFFVPFLLLLTVLFLKQLVNGCKNQKQNILFRMKCLILNKIPFLLFQWHAQSSRKRFGWVCQIGDF